MLYRPSAKGRIARELGSLVVKRFPARRHTRSRDALRTSTSRMSMFSLGAVVVVLCSSVLPASALAKSAAVSADKSARISTTGTATRSKLAKVVVDTIGVANGAEPSGYGPSSASALPGYAQSYVNDFTGTKLPSGWSAFTGSPNGDTGAQWASSHAVVSNNMLQLNAWQDPAYNNEWVAGGVCQCGLARTYGAYFVRSKLSGPGATQVEMLWPTSGWPPEIDFDETGGLTNSSLATLHYSTSDQQFHSTINIDMTQWHTWGVIWTPTLVTYVVDGTVWGTVDTASAIPAQPMTLDITQQTWCSAGWACPTSETSTDVDWVTEYIPSTNAPPATTTSTTTTDPATTTTTVAHRSGATTTAVKALATVENPVTVRPFSTDSAVLSKHLKTEIVRLARRLKSNGEKTVTLVGYGDRTASSSTDSIVSRARARAVEKFLRRELVTFRVRGITIVADGEAATSTVTANGAKLSRAMVRTVVAVLS